MEILQARNPVFFNFIIPLRITNASLLLLKLQDTSFYL